jgi:ribonuclease T1
VRSGFGRLRPLGPLGWLVVIVVALAACGFPLPEPSGATPIPTAPAPSSAVASAVASLGLDPDSGLPLVALSALPPEATEVMGLIGVGGPFPYPQDGAVFENREALLPDADVGYYHEYTVPTPGSPDRGARRIVIADQGEAYWTDDHYASFWRIAP